MKSTGILRKVDELGRVVIPIELRNKLDIHEKDPIYLKEAYDAACELAKQYNWYEIKCVKDGEIRTIQDINDEIFAEVKKGTTRDGS